MVTFWTHENHYILYYLVKTIRQGHHIISFKVIATISDGSNLSFQSLPFCVLPVSLLLSTWFSKLQKGYRLRTNILSRLPLPLTYT